MRTACAWHVWRQSALKAIKGAVGGGPRHATLLALHEMLESELGPPEAAAFYARTLPHVCALALALPRLCRAPIPLLRGGRAAKVSVPSPSLAAPLRLSPSLAFSASPHSRLALSPPLAFSHLL